MFGGVDLSRNKEWVDSTINFALDGFVGAQAIKKYPTFVRPFVAKFIPALTKIKRHHATAQRVIVPILHEREKAAAAGWPESHGKPPADFLQWMLDAAVGDEKQKSFIAQIQLKLSFAAIHTSAAAPTQLLYDLCSLPEHIEGLRDEINEARASGESELNKRTLLKLEKLDSLMKEAQRFNPLLLSKSNPIVCFSRSLLSNKLPSSVSSHDPILCPMASASQPIHRLGCQRRPSLWIQNYILILKSLTR